MSKAILVIDMPNSCLQCELSTDDDFTCFCVVNSVECSTVSRPTWCPLKEVPKKKKDTLMTNYSRYVRGWNDCIDRILEGSEEDE